MKIDFEKIFLIHLLCLYVLGGSALIIATLCGIWEYENEILNFNEKLAHTGLAVSAVSLLLTAIYGMITNKQFK